MHDILNEPIKIDNPSTNNNTVRISVLIDESGSMLGAAEATVNQLNSYLDEQATRGEPILVSVYTFNSKGVRNRFMNLNATTAPRLRRNNDLFVGSETSTDLIYAPSGGTPLWDAIGTVISQATIDVVRSDTPTLVVVLTDGEENESKEYRTLESIQTLIKAQEDKGWVFSFLMAGLSRAESQRYTTQLMGRNYDGATMSYSKGMETEAFKGLVGATAKWETSTRAAMAKGEVYSSNLASSDFFDESVRDIKKDD